MADCKLYSFKRGEFSEERVTVYSDPADKEKVEKEEKEVELITNGLKNYSIAKLSDTHLILTGGESTDNIQSVTVIACTNLFSIV